MRCRMNSPYSSRASGPRPAASAVSSSSSASASSRGLAQRAVASLTASAYPCIALSEEAARRISEQRAATSNGLGSASNPDAHESALSTERMGST